MMRILCITICLWAMLLISCRNCGDKKTPSEEPADTSTHLAGKGQDSVASLNIPLIIDSENDIVPAHRYALLVGISDYHALDKSSEWHDIHGADDVSMLYATLKEQGFDVDILTNGEATFGNITAKLGKIGRSAREGSVVLLHFSMHGQPFEDLDGDEAMNSPGDYWDESLVPIDAALSYEKGVYEGNNHLTDDILSSYVEKIRRRIGAGGHLYVTLDACHAGSSSKGTGENYIRGTKKAFSPKGRRYDQKRDTVVFNILRDSPDCSHVTYIEACTSTEVNTEINVEGRWYGALSYYINEELRGSPLGISRQWIVRLASAYGQGVRHRQSLVVECSR